MWSAADPADQMPVQVKTLPDWRSVANTAYPVIQPAAARGALPKRRACSVKGAAPCGSWQSRQLILAFAVNFSAFVVAGQNGDHADETQA